MSYLPPDPGLSDRQAELLSRLTGRQQGRSRRPAWLRAVVVAVVFGVVLAGAGGGLAAFAYQHYNNKITREDVLKTNDPHIQQKAKQLHAANYLVIGSDTRAGKGDQGYGSDIEGARSDTTMLVHLSPDRSRVTVVSFPRDSWVTIPACKTKSGTMSEHKDMFNSAFTFGGAACTISLVQALTGIAVTHYVQIDFGGFKSLVKALGTITVCSNEVVDDPKSHLTLTKGNNKLGPDEALAYVRARYTLGDGSDLGRIQRQQRFLGAVLRQARGGTLLKSPAALNRFLNAATAAITVDKHTSLTDLKTLADALRGLDPRRVTFYTAPIANPAYNPDDPSQPGGRVLLDDKTGKVLYNSIINDASVTINPDGTQQKKKTPAVPKTITVAPSKITVAVTNAAGTAYLGTKVQTALKKLGFVTRADLLGLDPRGATKTVVVYNGTAQLPSAQTVAASIPGATLQLDASHTGPVEVQVGSSYSGVRKVTMGAALPTALIPTSTSTTTTVKPSGGISAADTSCST